MGSGPLMPLVLKKEEAISEWRKLMGPTHIQRYVQGLVFLHKSLTGGLN